MTGLSESLGEVGESIWSQTLGATLVPCATPAGPAAEPMIQGQVQITGEWQGILILQCALPAARRATRAMFDRAEDELTREEICDTVGELTHMLGGTVKSIVAPHGCALSLPVVIDGTDYHVNVRDTRVVAQQAFEESGDPVVVTVLEGVR